MLLAQPAGTPAEQPAPQGSEDATFVKFLGGAALGLLAHEGGHVLFNVAFDTSPDVKQVSFGPIPFFAITHAPTSPRKEYAIASAGFWVQHATSEWLLSAEPGLREQRAPLKKGWLVWNVLSSTAYSVAAFGRFGPAERDTRGMAEALGVAEPWVGALALGPAVLDAWRYFDPNARWPRWLSRALKAGLVVLVFAAEG